MGLSITVLGCSGTYAGPGGACSGYLVRSNDTSVWVDTGPGSLANLQQHIDLASLDAIVVSHSHPDHWGELGVVRNALKYGFQIERMPLYSTTAVRKLVEIVCGDSSEPTFRWGIVANGDTITIGDLEFSFSETDHPVETLGMRIASNGRSLLYSADTGPGWSLEALGRGADLAVCEATLLEETEGSAPHLSSRQAGLSAAEAEVGQLVVTHFWPTSRPASARGRSGGSIRSRGGCRRAGQDLHGELRSGNAESRWPCGGRASPHHIRARLHGYGGRIRARVVRPHPRALHGIGRRGHASVDAGEREGVGDRRVLDVAGFVTRAHRTRGAPAARSPGARRRSNG